MRSERVKVEARREKKTSSAWHRFANTEKCEERVHSDKFAQPNHTIYMYLYIYIYHRIIDVTVNTTQQQPAERKGPR